MTSVRMIILKPDDISLSPGSLVNTKLASMDITTRMPMNLSFFAGGMIIARNIP